MTEQRAARSVRAYARGAQLAVALQLIVAVIAVGVSLWLGKDIARKRAQVQDLEERARQRTVLIKSSGEVLKHVQTSLGSLLRPEPVYSAAVAELQAADQALASQQGTEADALQRDEFRRLVLRSLANAQYRAGDAASAIQTLMTLRGLPQPDAAAASDTVSLAAYYCKTGDVNAARALVGGDFARQHANDLQGNDAFQAACPKLAQALAPGAHAWSTTVVAADPAYKIHYVYIQVRSETDRAMAERVANSLCDVEKRRPADVRFGAPGIEVIGPERTYPARAEVRYYYPTQQGEAATIARIAGEAAGAPLRIRPLSGVDGLPRDRLEIWLPASPGPVVGAAEGNAARRAHSSCRAAR